ncbi:response regulator [Saltatorellus ferox]
MSTNAPPSPNSEASNPTTPIESAPVCLRATPRVIECLSPLILVVEDDEDITRSLCIRLKYNGFEVETAATMDLALEQLERLKPDAAIVDMSIPGGDGIMLLEHIRSQAKSRDLPVIILTASVRGELESNALAAGASCFMHKPFHAPDLLGELDRLTGREG